MRKDAVGLRKPHSSIVLETCSIKVFDGMRLSGGRQDDLSIFSLTPGLTACVMRSLLVLIWPKI